MTPTAMVITSLLLGLYVTLAGCYGVLYCAGRIRSSDPLIYAAYTCFGLQLMVTAVLVLQPVLGGWWKVLIAVCCAVYLPIPPATWRYLDQQHRLEEHT